MIFSSHDFRAFACYLVSLLDGFAFKFTDEHILNNCKCSQFVSKKSLRTLFLVKYIVQYDQPAIMFIDWAGGRLLSIF